MTKINPTSPVSTYCSIDQVRQDSALGLELLEHPEHFQLCKYDAELIVRRAAVLERQAANTNPKPHKKNAEKLESILKKFSVPLDLGEFPDARFWETWGLYLPIQWELPLMNTVAGSIKVLEWDDLQDVEEFVDELEYSDRRELGLEGCGDLAYDTFTWFAKISRGCPILLARAEGKKGTIIGVATVLPMFDPNIGRPVILPHPEHASTGIVGILTGIIVEAIAPYFFHALKAQVHASKTAQIISYQHQSFEERIIGRMHEFKKSTKTDEEFTNAQ
jgi:hypothetical protein